MTTRTPNKIGTFGFLLEFEVNKGIPPSLEDAEHSVKEYCDSVDTPTEPCGALFEIETISTNLQEDLQSDNEKDHDH
jgi:hypothetical protein